MLLSNLASLCRLGNIASKQLYRSDVGTISKYLHSSTVTRAKLYSDKHEWVELVENTTDQAKVGITQYAADALGDVVYAQLPETGQVLGAGDECGALESVKAASEIYSPVSGTVTVSNEGVEDKPALINNNAEVDAWLFQLELSNLKELDSLMSKEKYQKFLESVTDDLD